MDGVIRTIRTILRITTDIITRGITVRITDITTRGIIIRIITEVITIIIMVRIITARRIVQQ